MNNTPTTDTKAKPTAGPWELTEDSEKRVIEERVFNNGLTITMPDAVYSVRLIYGKHTPQQKIVNVKAMIEAGTVYHETGLTPRELVERLAKIQSVIHGIIVKTESIKEDLVIADIRKSLLKATE